MREQDTKIAIARTVLVLSCAFTCPLGAFADDPYAPPNLNNFSQPTSPASSAPARPIQGQTMQPGVFHGMPGQPIAPNQQFIQGQPDSQMMPSGQVSVPPGMVPCAPVQAQPSKVDDLQMQGNLQIKGSGFKGSLQFDGNPLTLIQQAVPAVTTPPAPTQIQAPGSLPMDPAVLMQPPPTVPQSPVTAAPTSSQPVAAPPIINPADLEKAARALGNGVLQTIPKLGLPIDPRLLNHGTQILQSVFSAPNAAPVIKPEDALESSITSTNEVPEASIETLNTLVDLMKTTRYNLEQAEEALHLSTYGDATTRLAAALEAQKNANEARTAADNAVALVPAASGRAAEMITAIRDAAKRAQLLADQARANADAANGVSPQN